MSFTPFVIVWGVLALIVALIIVRRTMLGFHEDDSLNLHAPEFSNERQHLAKAHSIDVTDKWGRILSVVTALYGMALVAVYSYRQLY